MKSLFHWKVWVNLLVAVGLLVGLVWLTFRWLEKHTEHGQEIPVPNVVNMSLKDAIKEFNNQGLSYEVDSFKYNPKYRPLQVLDVFPKPGAKVKGARNIILKVNPSTWAKVQVPDVLDIYKGLAFRQLEQVGLKVGDTIFEHNIQKDAVIRMKHNGSSLKPGTLLPRFSTVDIVIGSGPMRDISVPNLIGMTVANAKKIIEGNLFELGLVDYEDGEDEEAIVYFQDPRVGDYRDQGMQIDLWASHKSLAELEDKVVELNSVYRKVAVDTTRHVIYEDVPVYRDNVPSVPLESNTVEPSTDSEIEKNQPENTTSEGNKEQVEKPLPEKPVEVEVE